MREYGVYEAKTKLPDLIKQVQLGERVTITNRGEPVADLVPRKSFGATNQRSDRGDQGHTLRLHRSGEIFANARTRTPVVADRFVLDASVTIRWAFQDGSVTGVPIYPAQA